MIPITLDLKGFLSYREAVQLDFTHFDMACITGQNGAGKSSLLDAMTWALFGKARSTDDDLIHMQESETEVCLVFDYEGQRYAVTRQKKRGESKTMRLEIWGDDNQKWVNFSEATMTATQSKLERILRMDYDTFINASFFLQGKADHFAQQRPADRKQTLAKILELEIWDEYQKRTAAFRRQLETRMNTVNTQLGLIRDELAKEKDLVERRDLLQMKLVQLEATARAQEEVVLQFRRQQEQAGRQKQQVELLGRNLENAQKRVNDLTESLQRYQAEEEDLVHLLADEERIREGYLKWQRDQAELESYDQMAGQFEQIRAEREAPYQVLTGEEAKLQAQFQQLQAQAEKISEMRNNLTQLQTKLADTEEEEMAVEAECSRYVVLEEQFDDLGVSIRQVEMERSRMLRDMQTLKERIARLESVESAECPTCGQPLTKEHRADILREMKVQGQALRDQFETGSADLDARKMEYQSLDAEIKRLHRLEKDQLLKGLRPKLDSLRLTIGNLTGDIEEWEHTGQPSLVTIEQALQTGKFAMEARQVLDDIDQRLRELGYDARAHDQMRQRVRAGREIQQTWESLGKARATLETVQRMMIEQQSQLTAAGMELETAKLAYDTAQDQYEALLQGANGFTEANRQWLEMRNAVSQTSRELGGAEQQVNSLQGYRDQQTMYANEKQTLSSKIDLYRQLEDAFSKNGIQALMIEQAIPEIEDQANDLLSQLSSTGMMVQFRTQEAYKDKRRTDMRETLDIVISDNAGVRSYEMYSGGEAFRVNFAIRLALSRMLAGRSGARLQTLVIDEGFGSQDAEGVQRLVEAINAIQGDFSKILVITHMETLKESFPAQIEVVKTPSGSQFQVLV